MIISSFLVCAVICFLCDIISREFVNRCIYRATFFAAISVSHKCLHYLTISFRWYIIFTMIKLLIKLFIKDRTNTTDKGVREKYGTLSGVLGILCNIFLFAVKFTVGTVMSSVAVISDSFNNLADSGSSVMTVISAKFSNKKPDADHPFGHGRFEYISSLIISFAVILVGYNTGMESIHKLTAPTPLNFSTVSTVILILSLGVKLWMFMYNRYIGRLINSPVLIASAKDSINDVISTCAVIISTVICRYTSLPADGIAGLAVSAYIIYSGINMAKETIGVLLGTKPDPQTVSDVLKYVMEPEQIVGFHDLIVHDYGPGRVMATVHAEVSDKSDILKIHEIIDDIEQRIYDELGILTVIHMDPISVDDELTLELKSAVRRIILQVDEEFSLHDFRIVKGEDRINVIFDLTVPPTFDDKDTKKLTEDIYTRVKEYDKRLCTVIKVEKNYY